MKILQSCFFFSLLSILSACSLGTNKIEHTYISPNSLEGPRLQVIGQYGALPVRGVMDRSVMVGLGKIELQSNSAKSRFSCTADLSEEPKAKGRVHGVLQCTGDTTISFVLRNLGPDQGVGVGKDLQDGKYLTFFYHSCLDEATRRFPEENLILQNVIKNK